MWILKTVVKVLISIALFVLMFLALVNGVGRLSSGDIVLGVLSLLAGVGLTALNRYILTPR